jgi:hypothetical protein
LTEWINEDTAEESVERERLLQKLALIKTLLETTNQDSITTGARIGTLEDFDQFFFCRAAKKLMILAPAEIFSTKECLVKSKVIAFLREQGATSPMMFTISGHSVDILPHPKMLGEDDMWTSRVFEFGVWHDHSFRTDGFDSIQGKDIGANSASHVEPRLMLWYACQLLGTFDKSLSTPERQMKKLHRLRSRRWSLGRKAEIMLNRSPCKSCLKYQEMLEEYTGLQYIFKVCSNAGLLKYEKNRRGVTVLNTNVTNWDADEESYQQQIQTLKLRIKTLESAERNLEEEIVYGHHGFVRSTPQVIIPSYKRTDARHPAARTPTKPIQKPLLTPVTTPRDCQKVTTKSTRRTTTSTTISISKRPRMIDYYPADNEEPDQDEFLDSHYRESNTRKRKSPRTMRSIQPAQAGSVDWGFDELGNFVQQKESKSVSRGRTFLN